MSQHHHEGLALFTPADVYFDRVDQVAARRPQALDAAYAAHPERFSTARHGSHDRPHASTSTFPSNRTESVPTRG